MQCSGLFYDPTRSSHGSQIKHFSAPLEFTDIPDAPNVPKGPIVHRQFSDSLLDFQPSQLFRSSPKSSSFLKSCSTIPSQKIQPVDDVDTTDTLDRLKSQSFQNQHQHSIKKLNNFQSKQSVTRDGSKNVTKGDNWSNEWNQDGKSYGGSEVQTPVPLYVQRQNDNGMKLRSVEELPERFRTVFDFPYFNIIQSKVFEEVMYTDKPLVISAPTGAGKTVIFELGIIRILTQFERMPNFKVVYMAPIKALCSEKFMEWQRKFEIFGLKCAELTGDTDIQDYYALQEVHIIFTTPEKWDSMTRRWRDNTCIIQSVRLFLIDEIHVLNDNSRGATIEAVISRMKTIQESVGRSSTSIPGLRFIAVSATIPNIEDVADWLGDSHHRAIFFKMDESLRPVRLRKVVLGFPFDDVKGSDFHFDMSLSYKLSGIVNTYSEGKPCLVFCSTRKSTQQASEILSRDSRGSYVTNPRCRQALQSCANMIKDVKLRDLVVRGVGFHHAGMDLNDRKLMENLFTSGDLKVLVATSTLAMGVNLPAHLVILKSTQHYNMGAIEEYSNTQVLQMIGRAGRPQFDTTATAVIMTKAKNKMKYESLLNGTQMIESSLHRNLIEHLNAEIVLHTINDMSIAMEWIRYTFLYIRVMKNPKHYSMPLGLNKEQVEKNLQETYVSSLSEALCQLDLCMRNLNQLAGVNLITMDGETFDIKPTEPGRLMARYCIAFESMKKFCNLSGSESVESLMKTISDCEEFTEIQLRVNEKKNLNILNKDKNRITIRYPMQGKIKTKQMKVNCLLQAQLGCLLVQDFSLQQDTTRIFRAAQRLSRCLVELLWTKQDYTSFLHAVQLCKCIKAKLWENSKYITKQLDGIGPALSNALANAGITSFQKIEETNPRELELIVNRHPPFGNQVRDSVASLPKYELTIEQVSQYSNTRADIIIHLIIANKGKLQEVKTPHTCVLLVGDEDNNIIFRRRIMDSILLKEDGYTKKLEIHRAEKGSDIYINLISQEWVGLDVQSTYSPFYLGAHRVSNTVHSQEQSQGVNQSRGQFNSMKNQNRNTGPCQTPSEFVSDEMKTGCNHRCANKNTCGHKCCNTGITLSRKPSKTPSISNYMSGLKNKLSFLTDTPSSKRIKMTPQVENKFSMSQFAYTPRSLTWNRPSNSLDTSKEESENKTYDEDDGWSRLNLYQKHREESHDDDDIEEESLSDTDIDMNHIASYDNFDPDSENTAPYHFNRGDPYLRRVVPGGLRSTEQNLYNRGTHPIKFAFKKNALQTRNCHVNDYTDIRTLQVPSNEANFYVADEMGYQPLYVDNEHNDMDRNTHRYGQVIAWSNSQKTSDSPNSVVSDVWSGSDNDLISADQLSHVHKEKVSETNEMAQSKKKFPDPSKTSTVNNNGSVEKISNPSDPSQSCKYLFVNNTNKPVEKNTERTDVTTLSNNHFSDQSLKRTISNDGAAEVISKPNRPSWSCKDFFCTDAEQQSSEDDPIGTFNSIFDGIF